MTLQQPIDKFKAVYASERLGNLIKRSLGYSPDRKSMLSRFLATNLMPRRESIGVVRVSTSRGKKGLAELDVGCFARWRSSRVLTNPPAR